MAQNNAQVEIPTQDADMTLAEQLAALREELAASEAKRIAAEADAEATRAAAANPPAKPAFVPTCEVVQHPVGYKATPQSWASQHVYVEAYVQLTPSGKPRRISERRETWEMLFANQDAILAAFAEA